MSTESHLPPILHAKLHRPAVFSGVFFRSRLIEQLNQGLSGPLTLVCAPAGFGKSTLVSSWLDTLMTGHGVGPEPHQAVWLSLDDGDNDIHMFLHYMVSAIRSVLPAACTPTHDLITSPVEVASSVLTATLLNDLDSLPSRLIVVLEDFHFIHDEAVVGFVRELIHLGSPQLHLVLTSRIAPALPLARTRAAGQITEIRSGDLRFTQDEARAFLTRMLPVPLSDQALSLLYTRTEGWIVGLRLAALSLASATDIESAVREMQSTDTYITDYLMDEVLSKQSPELQAFLLQTSMLDRFCDDLAVAVLASDVPRNEMRRRLDSMEQAGLLLVPLDSGRHWYRYHALFREMLFTRLTQEFTPEQIANMHRRASTWYGLHALYEEALHHALAAQDDDLAAQWIEEGLVGVLNREDRLTLERWLHLLPESLVNSRPGLLLLWAWTLEFSWQIEAQDKVLAHIEALLESDPQSAGDSDKQSITHGQLATFYAQRAYFGRRPHQSIAFSEEALSRLPPNWHFVRGGAAMYRGLALQAIGHSEEALHMQRALYEAAIDRSTSYAIRPLMTMCFIHLLDGHLELVIQTAEALLAQGKRTGLPIQQGWGHYFLGTAAYLRHDLAGAVRHFEAVLAAQHVTQKLTFTGSAYGLVLCYQAMGDAARAWQIVDMLNETDLASRGIETEHTRSIRARLHLLEESIEDARRVEQSLHAVNLDQPLLWLEEPPLTRCRVLLATGTEGSLSAALELLDSLEDLARSTHNVPAQIEVLALRALVLASQPGQPAPEALRALSEAVELARSSGIVRPFLEYGAPMRALLGRLSTSAAQEEFVQRILSAARPENAPPHPGTLSGESMRANHRLAEPLSRRELDILVLMSQRLTNKEIAHLLTISPKTVKRHAANLYAKLDVNRRWDAVEKAIELGLLPVN